jgi:hypothetical protein
MKDAYVSPNEAVNIHKDLCSNPSVPIYWDSFQLSEEPMDVPPQDWSMLFKRKRRYLWRTARKLTFVCCRMEGRLLLLSAMTTTNHLQLRIA